MTANTVDGKRLLIRQLKKKTTEDGSTLKKIPAPILPPQRQPLVAVPSSSSVQTSDTLIARTKVTPTTRIVVVRTTTSTQNETGETIESNEAERSKSVELSPMLTNGVHIYSSKKKQNKHLSSSFFSSVHLFI